MENTDEAKGRIKEAAGDLTGDKDLQREGKVDQVSGKAKDAVDKAGDKAKDALKTGLRDGQARTGAARSRGRVKCGAASAAPFFMLP